MRRLRAAVQWIVFALIVWGGVDLYRFALQLEGGRAPSLTKPLSPEGFLPIGSLMSFKLWVTTGTIDTVHPAGLMLFTAALALSLLLKKSFCGWICPVGTLSELLGTAGRRVFGRLLTPPRWLDVPLRSLKYALLGFFLWIILVKMPAAAIREWLRTDYWKIADLKMLGFFRHPTALATGVIGVPGRALAGDAEFLVPLPLPLRRAARTAELRRCSQSAAERGAVHALPPLHEELPGAAAGRKPRSRTLARVPGLPDLRQPLSGARARSTRPCLAAEPCPRLLCAALVAVRPLGGDRGGENHRPLGSGGEHRRLPEDRSGTRVRHPPVSR